MKYERVLLCISLVLVPLGALLAIDPAAISDAVGLRQTPHLERACALYEAAKQDLVRLNGGHVMGIGLFCWILRPVQDPGAQRRVLLAMLVSILIGMALTFRTVLGGNTTALAWVPIGLQGLILTLLGTGYWRLRQAVLEDADA